jgi:hypothetical protein
MRAGLSDCHFIKWLHQPHFVIAGSSLGFQNSFAQVVCSRLRLCPTMVQGVKTFRRPSLQPCLAISGGLLKKPEIVQTVGPGSKFLSLNTKTPWLCKTVSKSHVCRAPLRRTTVLQHLISECQRLLCQAAVGIDPMQELQISSLAHEEERPRVRKRKNKTASAEVEQESAMSVKMPVVFIGGASKEYTIRAILPKNGKEGTVWVHVDDIQAVLEYLFKEVEMQGVAPLPEAESHEEIAKVSVWWDSRDLAWCARGTDPSGGCRRLQKSVPRKDSSTGDVLTVSQFQAAKKATREEVDMWIGLGD